MAARTGSVTPGSATPGSEAAQEQVAGYRGLTLVGRGGFSVVYRARQEAFERDVALKVLMIDVGEDAQRRFLREVRLTSALTGHPHAVTLLDAGLTQTGRPYLATEFFTNGSLRNRIAAGGPLPAEEVARIGAKIAEALAAAHSLGIVHRDVKPNNILLSQFAEPALADFGVACLIDPAGRTGSPEAFTPYHAAPEMLNGTAPNASCDVYALGSTLYELLTGHPAFELGPGGFGSLLTRILTETPPSMPGEPGSPLAAVIRTAMAKRPEDRFADASAMAQALWQVSGTQAGGGVSGGVQAVAAPVPATALPIMPASAGSPAAAGAGPTASAGWPATAGAGPTASAGPPLPAGAGWPAVAGAGPAVSAGPAVGAGPTASAGPPMFAPANTAPPEHQQRRPWERASASGIFPGPLDPSMTVLRPERTAPADPAGDTGNGRRRRSALLVSGAAVVAAGMVGAVVVLTGSSAKNPAAQNTGAHLARPASASSSAHRPASTGSPDTAPHAGVVPGSPPAGPSSADDPGSDPATGTTQQASGPARTAGAPSTVGASTSPKAPGPRPPLPTTTATAPPHPAPSTTASAAPPPSHTPVSTSCTGWHFTNDSNGYGTMKGAFHLVTGPYESCDAVAGLSAGQKLYYWCYVDNAYGHRFIYGRLSGTDTAGWMSAANLNIGPGSLNHC